MSKNGVYSIDVVIEKMVEGKKKLQNLKFNYTYIFLYLIDFYIFFFIVLSFNRIDSSYSTSFYFFIMIYGDILQFSQKKGLNIMFISLMIILVIVGFILWNIILIFWVFIMFLKRLSNSNRDVRVIRVTYIYLLYYNFLGVYIGMLGYLYF